MLKSRRCELPCEPTSNSNGPLSLSLSFCLCISLTHTRATYVQVDFPSTVSRKQSLIESTPQLISLVENASECVPGILDSTQYALVGCDLCHLSELARLLQLCGLNYCVPTLLLSECVLTYVEPERYVYRSLCWNSCTGSMCVPVILHSSRLCYTVLKNFPIIVFPKATSY